MSTEFKALVWHSMTILSIGDGGKSSAFSCPRGCYLEDIPDIKSLIRFQTGFCFVSQHFQVNLCWTVYPSQGKSLSEQHCLSLLSGIEDLFRCVRQTAAMSPARPPHPGKQSNLFCYYTCYQHSTSLPASPFHLSQHSSFLSECTSSFSNFLFGRFNTQITIPSKCTHSNLNFPFTGFSSFSEEENSTSLYIYSSVCLVKCNTILDRIWVNYLFVYLFVGEKKGERDGWLEEYQTTGFLEEGLNRYSIH